MDQPRRPKWLLYSSPRRLRLRFDRSLGSELVLTFESGNGLRVRLSTDKLPKGIAAKSVDPAKQEYAIVFAKKGHRVLDFAVNAPEAKNAGPILSVRVDGKPELDLPINTYNIEKINDLKIFLLVCDCLAEMPRWLRYGASAIAIVILLQLLNFVPAVTRDNVRKVGIQFGMSPNLARNEFVDDFAQGARHWYRSGDCAQVPLKTTAQGRSLNTFLKLSSTKSAPCVALAKLDDPISVPHPLAQTPSFKNFKADLSLEFGSSNLVNVMLHARRTQFGFPDGKVRGDRLSIERITQPADNSESKKLMLKMNCSSECPNGQWMTFSSHRIREPIATIALIITSASGHYAVQVVPNVEPYIFRDDNGNEAVASFNATSPTGSVGVLVSDNQDFKLWSVHIAPAPDTR